MKIIFFFLLRSGGMFRNTSNLIINLSENISFRAIGKKYFFGAGIFFFFVLFSSCKDPEELGLEVIPSSDQLALLSTDTLTLMTRTVKEDSLQTYPVLNALGNSLTSQLLGNYRDPVFGKSDASFYTQVKLGLIPSFGDSV